MLFEEENIIVVIEHLVLWKLHLLVDYIISYLNHLIAIVDVPINENVQVWFKPTDELHIMNLFGIKHIFRINIKKWNKLISFVFVVLDSCKYQQPIFNDINSKVKNFWFHLFLIFIYICWFESAKFNLNHFDNWMQYSFLIFLASFVFINLNWLCGFVKYYFVTIIFKGWAMPIDGYNFIFIGIKFFCVFFVNPVVQSFPMDHENH